MQLTCVRAFGRHEVGDVAEVPDGATFDPEHWEAAGLPEKTAPALPDLPVIPKKEM